MLTIDEDLKNEEYSLLPAWGFVPAGSDQALKALVTAIIVQAVRDARKNSWEAQEARAWLLGEDCALYAGFIGLDHKAIRKWVTAGCPKRGRRAYCAKESYSQNGKKTQRE